MSEINPYESPQSVTPARADNLTNNPYPSWLGLSLWAQMIALFFTFTMGFNPRFGIFTLGLLGILGLITLLNLFTAIRYRIGWLVILELIVIVLPLEIWFTVG